MAETMTPEQIILQEMHNTGTTWTRNDFMEKHGYLIIRNLWNPEELYHPVPMRRGQFNYHSKDLEDYDYEPIEQQVEGSVARYWHPQYRSIHSGIRMKVEKELGRKLYNTYYYDRYYFPGQELERHADRDACEISVTVHVGTNLDDEWPIWIKTPDEYSDKSKRTTISTGDDHSVILKPGDGMVYKGCERPHWRNPMPGEGRDTYYHQIFFHYVLQDGQRAHYAWDRSK